MNKDAGHNDVVLLCTAEMCDFAITPSLLIAGRRRTTLLEQAIYGWHSMYASRRRRKRRWSIVARRIDKAAPYKHNVSSGSTCRPARRVISLAVDGVCQPCAARHGPAGLGDKSVIARQRRPMRLPLRLERGRRRRRRRRRPLDEGDSTTIDHPRRRAT